MQLYMVCSAIWSILREVASRGPSALADILVYTATVISHDTVLEMWWPRLETCKAVGDVENALPVWAEQNADYSLHASDLFHAVKMIHNAQQH